MTAPQKIRVIVTRPEPEASRFAVLLTGRGMTPVLSPVLRIDLFDIRDAIGAAGALAFTSANGVRSYLAAGGRADIPAYAVGEATAAAARSAGFASVRVAAGDAAALAGLLISERTAAILHVAGRDEAGDLCGALEERGVSARRVIGYAAAPSLNLTAPAVDALKGGGEAWVSLFSPRSARLFRELATQERLEGRLAKVGAACLSPAVADAAGEGWRRKAIARRADAAALIDALVEAR